jgi:hypothetical protein
MDRVRTARLEGMSIGDSTLDHAVSVLRSLQSVSDRAQRTYKFYQKWLQPQLSVSDQQIKATAAGTDYFISNLKMVLSRGGQILPGAAVTYDPPGSLEDLPKYRTQEYKGRILDLVALPKRLVDPDNRWGGAYQFTGFWRSEPASLWVPPPSLLAFLEQEPLPVVLTLGSMVMFDGVKLVQTFAEALRRVGKRGLILTGWSGIPSANDSSGIVYCAEEVPYDWLFPRACCVIHHGGCGTVAAALQAGKPSVLLPQITSQEHFGSMLVREKLATAVLDTSNLVPDELALAVENAITDDQVQRQARVWRETVAQERGVALAADLIESHRATNHHPSALQIHWSIKG